jgi:2-C-methyl-D-erythritol 4-phosphate cytidylyltransferase
VTIAVVLGAGLGVRLGGGLPKALRLLAGRPLLHYSLLTLDLCPDVDAMVVTVPEAEVEPVRQRLAATSLRKSITVVAGGLRRQDSVLHALAACPRGTEWVAVHDAARPFASAELFTRTIRRARETGGAIAALAVPDTIKRARHGKIIETLPRAELWAAQTPQVFRHTELQAALQACAADGREVTDEALAMELAGLQVTLVESDSANFKISTPADWARAERQLAGDA